jgi:Lon-like ATP-dependent protease
VGGVNAKIAAAIKAGAKTIIIPKENWQDKFSRIKGVKIVPVSKINEVFELAFTDEPQNSNIVLETKGEVLLAKTK